MPIAIGRGENRGREVTYHNVVRNLLKVGDWNGSSGSWTVPMENISREGVDAAVVYVQDGNRESPARCWARPTRRCTEFLQLSSFRERALGASPESLRCRI